jgi:hypothetical protein
MAGKKEGTMSRKGLKYPYKPKREYKYTLKDIAELAGMTRNALNVEKVRGKIDPADFGSVITFLIKRIMGKRLQGDLFTSAARVAKGVRRRKSRARVLGKRPKKTARRK